jgi:hypothetical protein
MVVSLHPNHGSMPSYLPTVTHHVMYSYTTAMQMLILHYSLFLHLLFMEKRIAYYSLTAQVYWKPCILPTRGQIYRGNIVFKLLEPTIVSTSRDLWRVHAGREIY